MEHFSFGKFLFFITLASSFYEFVDSRKLILNEITGASLRRNVLYVQSTVDPNKTFQIICKAPSDVKSATLTWTPSPSDAQGSVTSTPGVSSTLNLKNSVSDNFMEFNCTCNDASTNLEPTRLRFYKRDSAVILSDTRDIFINASDPNTPPISLVCKPPVGQLQSSSIIWFLDDKQLFSNSTRVQIFENGTLTISKPSFKDIGVYMCRVQDSLNRLGFFNVTGNVSIIQREVVNATGAAVDSVEGDTVKLMYSIYGNPLNLSALRWKRAVGNKTEDINDDFTKIHPEFANRLFFNPNTEGPNAELELRNVSKNDAANFTLTVDNIYGTSTYTTSVTVRVITKGGSGSSSNVRNNTFWFLIILLLCFIFC